VINKPETRKRRVLFAIRNYPRKKSVIVKEILHNDT
jgi:hypothetical protein